MNKVLEKTAPELITAAGIYRDIDIDDYHADKSWISSTGLRRAKKTLLEYKLYLDGGFDDVDKPCFSFGNAVELYLIDKAGFKKNVAIAKDSEWLAEALEGNPDSKNPRLLKSYQDNKKAFETLNANKYIIRDTGDESFETIKLLAERCMQNEWISTLLSNIEYQNSLYWIDKGTGLQMKTRPDVAQLKNNVIINIKTTLDASPEKFVKDLVNHDYPLQACIEIAGVEATGLMPFVDKYFWLVLEKNPPYDAVLYQFDDDDRKLVTEDYHYQLSKIKRAVDENRYPGYGERADNRFGIITAKLPSWYFKAEL